MEERPTSENSPWTNIRLFEVALLGHHPRSARHGSVVRATGCFETYVSVLTFIATVLPPPPSAAQGLFRHGVYEPQYDAQTREDVNHCEDLAYRCLRREVSQAHGGERGDAEVEGVNHVLSLDGTVEDRPAEQRDSREEHQGAELEIPPPSAGNAAKQAERGDEDGAGRSLAPVPPPRASAATTILRARSMTRLGVHDHLVG
jgi:hypothetical protein